MPEQLQLIEQDYIRIAGYVKNDEWPSFWDEVLILALQNPKNEKLIGQLKTAATPSSSDK